MSVAVAVRHSLSARVRLGQPKALQIWRAEGSVVGDASGGNVAFTLSLNPDSRTESGAWAITELEVYTGAASIRCEGRITTADWREAQSDTFRVVASDADTFYARLVKPEEPVNLGEILGSAAGQIVVFIATNTNLATHKFRARGLFAQQGFVVPRDVVL